jgi:hypothetical protein
LEPEGSITETTKADEAYREGFYDAQDHEPLFDDADPDYALGWRAFWSCMELAHAAR